MSSSYRTVTRVVLKHNSSPLFPFKKFNRTVTRVVLKLFLKATSMSIVVNRTVTRVVLKRNWDMMLTKKR